MAAKFTKNVVAEVKRKKKESKRAKADKAIDRIFQLNNFRPQPGYKEIADSIKDDQLSRAYRVGCSYGVGLFKRMRQPYYQCLTCLEATGKEELGVCQVCAVFCHAGHKLQPASQDLFILSVCDCGKGGFDSCEGLNSENPVEKLRGVTGCSVTHQTFRMILEKSQEVYD